MISKLEVFLVDYKPRLNKLVELYKSTLTPLEVTCYTANFAVEHLDQSCPILVKTPGHRYDRTMQPFAASPESEMQRCSECATVEVLLDAADAAEAVNVAVRALVETPRTTPLGEFLSGRLRDALLIAHDYTISLNVDIHIRESLDYYMRQVKDLLWEIWQALPLKESATSGNSVYGVVDLTSKNRTPYYKQHGLVNSIILERLHALAHYKVLETDGLLVVRVPEVAIEKLLHSTDAVLTRDAFDEDLFASACVFAADGMSWTDAYSAATVLM